MRQDTDMFYYGYTENYEVEDAKRSRGGQHYNTTKTVYDSYEAGMEYIRAIMSTKDWVHITPPTKYVGRFGVVHSDGYPDIIHWAVSGDRKDKRHGATNPVVKDKYNDELFNSMFKGWK